MISRKTAKSIAEAYCSHFTYTSISSSNRKSSKIYYESLYDFLFSNDFKPWLLFDIKNMRFSPPRALKEYIMQIHTGESIVTATKEWSWQERQTLGQRILKDLAQCLIRERIENPEFETYGNADKNAVDNMRLSLELDGYIFRNSMIFSPDDSILDESEEEDILENLMISVQLDDIKTIKYHLDLSADNFRESKWSDSISNSRKVLEAVLSQIAKRFSQIKDIEPLPPEKLTWASHVREYLKNNNFFNDNEKEAIAKIYGFLSETGSHPYIANQDQARLMRHLFLTICQFELLRLEGIIKEQKK